jgi:exonuclease SbcC
MRIKNLEIQGFGPYLAKQSIDFTQYEADGLFIIVGETGAGKSSILDAITFALYGSTPRWQDTAATKDNQTYRSHFAKDSDPTKVTLTFEVNGQEYRISRSPKYTTSTGKIVLDTVQLESLRDGESFETLAVKAKNVAEHIFSLLKLSSEEFLQVILLAQGRFDHFLQANSTERMELLSKIFNTGRFRTLEVRIDDIKKTIEQDLQHQRSGFTATLNALQNQLNEPGPESGEELKWIQRLSAKFNDLTKKAEAQVQAAQTKYEAATKAKRTAEDQDALAKIKADLKSIETQSKNIEALKRQLLLADSASRIVATFEARNESKVTFDSEASKFEKVQKEAEKNNIDPTKKGLDESLLRLIDELDALLKIEKDIPAWNKSISDLEAEIKFLDKKLSEHKSEVTVASKAILDLEKEETVYESAKATLDKNKPVIEKSEQMDELSEEIADLKANIPLLTEKATKAKAAMDSASEAERSNLASQLAATLIEGQPCAVCGSKEHPRPHKTSSASNKPKDISILQAALVDAQTNLETNTRSLKSLEDKHKKLKEALNGVSIAAIKKENAAALKVVDSWTSLLKELKRLRETIKPDSKVNKEISTITGKLPDSKAKLENLEDKVTAAKKDISKHLGEFKTIASKKAKAELDLSVLRSYLDAQNKLAIAEATLKRNAKALADLLTKEGFGSETDFVKAILSANDYKSMNKTVQEHSSELVRLNGLLDQDIYKSLPATKLNLSDALANFAAADETLKSAMQVLADSNAKDKAISSAEKQLSAFASKMETLSKKFIVHERLLNTVKGKSPNNLNMPLETFVLAAELEAILEAANFHLGKLSKGQYSFQHTEKSIQKSNAKAGLGIEIMDSHTSLARDAHSLSGGETFLASISLALGLAEVVTGRAGGISIDTLFIDEGFGSLSSEFLDLVIETLDSLRQGGRTIGVISHGDTMKERIASQLYVFKEPGGTSKVLQQA